MKSVQVEVKLFLQVVLVLRQPRGVRAAVLQDAVLRDAVLRDAPLHVVPDGLEQDVRAVHAAAVAARRPQRLRRLAGVQRDVTQQAGNHHRLVHVVDGADEAAHGGEQRVLLVVGVGHLHHS